MMLLQLEVVKGLRIAQRIQNATKILLIATELQQFHSCHKAT